MSSVDRPVLIIGNWKMHKSSKEAVCFIKELDPLVSASHAHVYLSVPFTAIQACAAEAKGTKIAIGAQNMHDAVQGAFTGEVSASMLIEAGARFVILGHSERRHLFKEDSGFINRKVKRAIQEGIQPIVCVGETIEQRKDGLAEETLAEQIEESLDGLDNSQIACLVLAYEPVWAIGTGHTATPEIAQFAHQFCRECIARKWGGITADHLPIIYGGSVKPENAYELLSQPDVDGLLVGGASLNPDSFANIVNCFDLPPSKK